MTPQVIMMGQPGKRSVDDASSILKKLYFIERELMRVAGGYHVNVSNWEVKKKLPLHIWQDSIRANELRTRVLEMRYPRRDVDKEHNPKLEQFLSSLIRVNNDAELLAGIYFVTKVALSEAYESYLRDADELEDAPTIAFMKAFPNQIREQIDEAQCLFDQLPENQIPNAAAEWQQAVITYLSNIGGLLVGEQIAEEIPELIAQRGEYTPPTVPKRDPRFTPAVYHMPPRGTTKFIERQIWQGINHVNEMWAAEIPALVMWIWSEMPWEFYLNCARWAYDETRHSMMGEERLKAWGFEIGVDYPVVADHYISASDKGELEVLALLHSFETRGGIWKSGLKADFEQEGDLSSSQDFDYDWADESIHLLYGHKWVLHRLDGDIDELEQLRDGTRANWNEWIAQKQTEWNYEPFMSRIETKIKEIEGKHHG